MAGQGRRHGARGGGRRHFDLFDVQPALGRLYSPAEDSAPESSPVVVLGHAFWQACFGGGPDVLGQELRVDRVVARVVGVARALAVASNAVLRGE